ncbi:hypothetical protein [Pelosinus sp. UFO1]|uniref:hypothetical protein n=1 Tax=Pelosinus sp. UFO1 TaxID=484770 RepID=UPI0011855CDA|nr:hypothetical protein [Pelosinus sp. UFO1]
MKKVPSSTSSSLTYNGNNANFSCDGNTSSSQFGVVLYNHSEYEEGYVVYSFSDEFDLKKINVYAQVYGVGYTPPRDYKLLVSTDGTNFTEVQSYVDRPKTGYIDTTTILPMEKLLILTADQKVYFFSVDKWQEVSADWSVLNDAQRKALLVNGMSTLPPASELAKLGIYKILRFTLSTPTLAPQLKLTAVSIDQLILPKGLISATNLVHLKKVELTGTYSGQGTMHVVVTTDGKVYLTWDGTAFVNCINVDGLTLQKWVSNAWVDTNRAGLAAHIKANGITPSVLAGIPMASWDSLILGKTGYGFGYLPTIEVSTDVCANDKVTVTLIKNGKYRKAVHPIEYDIEYDTMDHVILKESGDWEILHIS